MSSPSQSNIRVFVEFKEDTVFAGEDVECTITFKHVQPQKPARPRQTSAQSQNGLIRTRSNQIESRRSSTQSVSLPTRQSSVTSTTPQRPTLHARSETDTSALNVVDSFEARDETYASATKGFHIADAGPNRKHGRSVSIISLGGDAGGGRPRKPSITIPSRPRGHARAASLQVTPTFGNKSPRVSSLGQPRSAGIKSPLATNQPMFQDSSSIRRNGSPGDGRSPSSLSPAAQARASAAGSPQGFKFPGSSEPSPNTVNDNATSLKDSKSKDLPLRRTSPQGADETRPAPPPQRPSLARVFSAQSVNDTPRSSVDFYSQSNHSNETLTSERASQASKQLLRNSNHSRSPSGWRSPSPRKIDPNETLMMGYAQIQGTFTLDGSLVNAGPFDEVKRRAVVGGQAGGGVVGVARPNEEGGIWGGFGGLKWGNIGESLGGLLKSGEQSSLKEMKGIADSKNIPLISTAKSILFVDLKLEPGQSRSFSYSFGMPRGLPPSHRGRAMKVSYTLVVGTQRPGSVSGQQQQIRQVEIPFRVFGGVNERGEVLGHDLMSPYIILKDQARTFSIDAERTPPGARTPQKIAGSAADFQTYVNHLLTNPGKDSDMSLLSPTDDLPETPTLSRTLSSGSSMASRLAPSPLPPPTTRSLIDLAIRTSTRPTSTSQSPTNFTIARASVPIATLTLSRPALKLGDMLTSIIDFSNASLPCYAVEATLESVERIDPSLAIRSQQSIERATRRVWARTVANCVWARRCVFQCQVPVTATPAFDTTGVSLEWCVRLEIVVAKQVGGTGDVDDDEEDADDEEESQGRVDDAAHRSASSSDNEGEALTPSACTTNARSALRHTTRQAQTAVRSQAASASTVPPALSKAEQLLDEVGADERGRVYQAAQWLPCESFEVSVPVRVFGALATAGTGTGEYGAAAEGMVI